MLASLWLVPSLIFKERDRLRAGFGKAGSRVSFISTTASSYLL
jgi:hypothetical protein